MTLKLKSLQDEFPEIAKQWHPTKNGKLTPNDVSQSQALKIWWICNCGNVWQASLNERQLRSKKRARTHCKKCGYKRLSKNIKKRALERSGTFKNKFPDLFKELHPTKNKNINFDEITPHSHIRVWWKCKKNHVWSSRLNNRTSLFRGCPDCKKNTSKIELRLYCELKKIFNETLWQHKLHKKEIDIFIPSIKLCIEIDGYPWHENKFNLDQKKNKHIEKYGYNFLRIREKRLPKHFGKNEIIDYFENSLNIYIAILNYILVGIDIKKSKKQKISKFINQNKFQATKEYKLLLSKLPGPIKDEDRFDLNFPDLLKEWNYAKNNPLMPDLFFRYSHDKVWWICKKKHVWQATIALRTQGRNCPKCAIQTSGNRRRKAAVKKYGTFFDNNKLLFKEWDFKKNKSIDMNNMSPSSNNIIWWKCLNCKHSWKTAISQRTRGRGCKKCARKIVGLKNKIRYTLNLSDKEKEKINSQIIKLKKINLS